MLVLLEDEEVLPLLKNADTKKKLGEGEFFDAILDLSKYAPKTSSNITGTK